MEKLVLCQSGCPPPCSNSVRYLILALAFLMVCSLYANISVYNLTILYTPLAARQRTNFPLAIQSDDGTAKYSPATGSQRIVVGKRSISPVAPVNPSSTKNAGSSLRNGRRWNAENSSTSHRPSTTSTIRSSKSNSKEGKILSPTSHTRMAAFASTLTDAHSVQPALAKPSGRSDELGGRDDLKAQIHSPAPRSTDQGGPQLFDNGSLLQQPVSSYTEAIGSMLVAALPQSAPGVGILLGHFPAMILLRRLGTKRLMAAALVLSATATAVHPYLLGATSQMTPDTDDGGDTVKSMKGNIVGLTILRFITGITFAPVFIFLGVNAYNWGSVREQLLFLTMPGFLAMQIAPAASWLSVQHYVQSSLLQGEALFTHAYFLHATVSVLVTLIWLLFYQDIPQWHQCVNGSELNRIMAGKPSRLEDRWSPRKRRPDIHVLSGQGGGMRAVDEESLFPAVLAKSISAWSVWCACIGYFLAHTLYAQFLPHYVFAVLKQPLGRKVVATPFLLLAGGHLLTLVVCNKCIGHAPKNGTVWVRVINTLGIVVSALLLLAIAIVQPRGDFIPGPLSPTLLLTLGLLPLGLVTGGFVTSAVAAARAYYCLIVAHMQIVLGLTMVILPLVVHYSSPSSPLAAGAAEGMTVANSPPNSKYEADTKWRLLFASVSMVQLIGAAVFAILGSGEASSWAEESWDAAATHRMGVTTPMLRRASESEVECGVVEMRVINGRGGRDIQGEQQQTTGGDFEEDT